MAEPVSTDGGTPKPSTLNNIKGKIGSGIGAVGKGLGAVGKGLGALKGKLGSLSPFGKKAEGPSEPAPLNPENNPKNMILLAKIKEIEKGGTDTPLLSTGDIIKKVVKDPFYLVNTTQKLIDVSIHPELLEPESKITGFFAKNMYLFFRNYFKIAMLCLFVFHIAYLNQNLHDSRLKIMLFVMLMLSRVLFVLLTYDPDRTSVYFMTSVFFPMIIPLLLIAYSSTSSSH